MKNSGLDWSIGRNGIYIEPDIEYLEHYVNAGKIVNCAGDGKCGYTTRGELGYAYAQMGTSDTHNGHTYNLTGQAMTQGDLAKMLSDYSGKPIDFESMSVEDYLAERKTALGDFLGTVIAGIYKGIRMGSFDVTSHYQQAAGRPHMSWDTFFRNL